MNDLTSIIGEPVEMPTEAPAPAPEAPQEQAAAPAPAPAAEQEHQPEAEPKMVPLAALHEERMKRRELAAQAETERRAREDLERRMEQRLQALQQAMQPKAPEPPSLEDNPVGHIVHKVDALQAQQQALLQQSQQERMQAAQAAAVAQVAQLVQHDEASFKARTPDYLDAVGHLHTMRVRELQALGVGEFAAEQQSAAELKQFAFVTASQGRSAAETAYSLAKAKGYAGKAAAAPAQAPSASEQMQMAQRGAAAASSLGNGSATGGQITMRQLASMSDEEFAEATSGGKWERVLGGT